MKTYFSLICLFFSFFGFGQTDTTIYTGINGKIVNAASANKKFSVEIKSKKKMTLTTSHKGKTGWEETKKENFKETGNLTYIVTSGGLKKNSFTRNYTNTDNGTYKFTEVSDNKITKIGYTKTIIPLILHGEITEFYDNGTKRSVSEYVNNELVSNRNWLENGEQYYDSIFYSVDNTPFYIPGNNRLHEHILNTMKEKGIDFSGITGNMVVGFIVFKEGTIGGFRIIKGIQPNINQVVISALSSLNGKWQPAKLNDKKVRYFQLLPINFIYNAPQYQQLEMEGGILQWSSN